MDANTGESPGHQNQSNYLGHSHNEEEMGHWTPTGAAPMVIWMEMDGILEKLYSSLITMDPGGKITGVAIGYKGAVEVCGIEFLVYLIGSSNG